MDRVSCRLIILPSPRSYSSLVVSSLYGRSFHFWYRNYFHNGKYVNVNVKGSKYLLKIKIAAWNSFIFKGSKYHHRCLKSFCFQRPPWSLAIPQKTLSILHQELCNCHHCIHPRFVWELSWEKSWGLLDTWLLGWSLRVYTWVPGLGQTSSRAGGGLPTPLLLLLLVLWHLLLIHNPVGEGIAFPLHG